MLALADFDGAGHEDHVVDAAPLAACTAAHPGFIGLNDFPGLAADPVLVGANHADPEFVENLEGGLVARQSELPLELNGRHARRLAGNQVGCPEPDRKWGVRPLHDRTSGEARVVIAMATPENAEPIREAIRFIRGSTMAADESVAPASTLKIGRACRFVREQSLKLGQRMRERHIPSLKNIDRHDRHRLTQVITTLPVVGLGDNRISTLRTMR